MISDTLQSSILHKSFTFAVLIPFPFLSLSIVALLIPCFSISEYVDSPFCFIVFQNGS